MVLTTRSLFILIAVILWVLPAGAGQGLAPGDKPPATVESRLEAAGGADEYPGHDTLIVLDKTLNRVGVKGVLQVSDRAFFLRSGRWIDSRLVGKQQTAATVSGIPKPNRTVKFGTPEYRTVVNQLIKNGRQALLAVRGPKLMLIDGKRVLVLDPEGS